MDDIVDVLRDPDYAGALQHLRSWDEIDRLFNAAADLIESMRGDLSDAKVGHRDCIKRNIALAGDISRLTKERDEARRRVRLLERTIGDLDPAEAVDDRLLRKIHMELQIHGEKYPDRMLPVLHRNVALYSISKVIRGHLQEAAIRQKSDVPTDVNDIPEGECAHDWFDCSNAHVPPPAKSCRKCGWTVGDDEARGIYLIWPWLEAERKERERANVDL